MLSALSSTAPRPAGPATGATVAHLVYDGMPGEGVFDIQKGERLGTQTWSSAADAEAGARALTAGDDAPAAGIFRRDGRYEAYSLTVDHRPYLARESDYVARSVAGRGLVTIVDGADAPDLMSEQSFRSYKRYAT